MYVQGTESQTKPFWDLLTTTPRAIDRKLKKLRPEFRFTSRSINMILSVLQLTSWYRKRRNFRGRLIFVGKQPTCLHVDDGLGRKFLHLWYFANPRPFDLIPKGWCSWKMCIFLSYTKCSTGLEYVWLHRRASPSRYSLIHDFSYHHNIRNKMLRAN